MPFFAGEIFVCEVHKKPVLDQTGEEIGRLKDIIVITGEPFPAVSALVVSSVSINSSYPRTVSTFSINALFPSMFLPGISAPRQRYLYLSRSARQANCRLQRSQICAG